MRNHKECGSSKLEPAGMASALPKESFELFNGQASVPHDTTHDNGVDGVRAWDGENSDAVGHDDVLALAHDAKPGLFESENGSLVVDPGNTGHRSTATSISRTSSPSSCCSTTARYS